MSNNLVSYRITDKNVDVYKENRHRLPCINCFVRATCFSEKQATKKATVELIDPCPEAIFAMGLINIANDLEITVKEMYELDIDNLFDDAVTYFHTGDRQFMITSFFMFQKVIEKNPEYMNPDGDNAYYYLGLMYRNNLNELDAAIEHFTKAIELDPNDCLALKERGFCWAEKGDMKKALADYKKAKIINCAGISLDIDTLIKEAEIQIAENSN